MACFALRTIPPTRQTLRGRFIASKDTSVTDVVTTEPNTDNVTIKTTYGDTRGTAPFGPQFTVLSSGCPSGCVLYALKVTRNSQLGLHLWTRNPVYAQVLTEKLTYE